MSGDVIISYLHPAELAQSFHKSLLDLILWDAGHDTRVHSWHTWRCGSGGIVEGRNRAAIAFLNDPDRPDWLLVIDADMGFRPDSLDRLLAAADPVERPVVGGLCFGWKELDLDGLGGHRCAARPTIIDRVTLADGTKAWRGRQWYPSNTLTQCHATGCAFLLVHRSVLERIGAEHGPRWFDRVTDETGANLGEDVSFCVRVAAAGFPLFVHTGVRTNHQKTTWVSDETYWSGLHVPHATDDVAVIVPVLGRPEHAARFQASLRATTGLARTYAICSDDDDAAAWTAAGAAVVRTTVVRFAPKVNAGYRASDEPWLLVVGSDVVFRPGWLDHAQWVAQVAPADVIGTNDLGNPRVIAGDHATHMLIRRSYVDEVGASWDGPGIVAHEGYRHWFVDDEIVTAAKMRGVWAAAQGSIVEHLHPAWGKAQPDSVYELGERHAEQDRARFLARFDAQRALVA